MKNPTDSTNVEGKRPARYFGFLLVFGSQPAHGHVGGIAQSAEAQPHRLAERHDATDHRPAHPFVLFRGAFQRLRVRRQGAIGPADADAPGMGRAHHDAFEHGLAADQGFLTALQSGQELDGC